MANTVTITNILPRHSEVVVYATILSDGTELTDQVIYDSSVVATALGIADPLKCKLLGVKYVCSTLLDLARLEFDATTDVVALALPGGAGSQLDWCFDEFGGLPNYAGTGITGDITLTTTALEANAMLTIILRVRPH